MQEVCTGANLKSILVKHIDKSVSSILTVYCQIKHSRKQLLLTVDVTTVCRLVPTLSNCRLTLNSTAFPLLFHLARCCAYSLLYLFWASWNARLRLDLLSLRDVRGLTL